jgi:SAM-dependent methyltransferase
MIYSCVVDPRPKFVHQLTIWVTTLTELGGVRADDILVHVLDGEYSRQVVDFLSERGIAHEFVARFGDGRFCNKLGQLRNRELRGRGPVVLCDTDLAFSGRPPPLAGGRAAAKPVDLPNPAVELLEELYRRAGFTQFPERVRCSHADAWTLANNCNGGLYVLDGDLLDELSGRWEKWALWTLEQRSLLGSYAAHADQVSFGLAMWELGEPVVPLPPAANFPLHLPLGTYDPACPPPVVLHYHDRLGADGLLLPLGLAQVDDRVALVNGVLERRRRTDFDNGRFWNFRYGEHPQLGSGLGSRGAHAEEKRRIIAGVIADIAPASVLDVGCGDLYVTAGLGVARYFGLDISGEAIRIARERRPDWTFAVGDVLSGDAPPADLVLCMDVLIHERDAWRYRAAVERLAELAGRELVIAAYNQEPWLISAMTFFHEPISRTLHATGRFASVEIIGGYRDTTVVRATRSGSR